MRSFSTEIEELFTQATAAQCALDERNADQYSFVAVDDVFYDDTRRVCALTRDESCTG